MNNPVYFEFVFGRKRLNKLKIIKLLAYTNVLLYKFGSNFFRPDYQEEAKIAFPVP
jgi:hypothetical protein